MPTIEEAAERIRRDRRSGASEIARRAAIGCALQQILARRGFLDSLGNQVPVAALAQRLVMREEASTAEAEPAQARGPAQDAGMALASMRNGKKCPECGARAVIAVASG